MHHEHERHPYLYGLSLIILIALLLVAIVVVQNDNGSPVMPSLTQNRNNNEVEDNILEEDGVDFGAL